jgi:O-antigen/teichoic acid export membrane protein
VAWSSESTAVWGTTAIDELTTHAPNDNGAGAASITTGQIRGSSLLLSGRVIALGVNFAVQVLIARYLSQSAYGAFAYALSLVTLFETVVTLGLDRGVGRFLAIYDEHGDRSRVLGTVVLVAVTVLSLGTAVVLLTIGVQATVGSSLIGDEETEGLLAILILLAPLQAADNMLGGVLAVFASARAIFFRKYILAPGLRLVVVVLLIAGSFDVDFLAVGYVVSGAIGVGLYVTILWRVLREREVLTGMTWRAISIPGREILAFTVPLLTTDLVYIAIHSTDAIILGQFWGTTAVAEYRVIQPLVLLNQIVYSSFTLLYMPAASRLFARQDREGVASLYWRTAIWMAVLSFPIFALTTSLAEPITAGLYGERYAGSAPYLAMLSFAAYLNVALGFNGLTLRVFGFLRYIVVINIVAAATSVALNLLLIPPMGPLGAAIATTASVVVFNMLKQGGLRRGTGISVFDRRYAWVYATVALAAIALAVVQFLVRPGFILSVVAAGVASIVVLALTRRTLDVAGTFPEVLRLPLARRILGA